MCDVEKSLSSRLVLFAETRVVCTDSIYIAFNFCQRVSAFVFVLASSVCCKRTHKVVIGAVEGGHIFHCNLFTAVPENFFQFSRGPPTGLGPRLLPVIPADKQFI